MNVLLKEPQAEVTQVTPGGETGGSTLPLITTEPGVSMSWLLGLLSPVLPCLLLQVEVEELGCSWCCGDKLGGDG